MTALLTLAGLWLGTSAACVAALLWVANRETLADLDDAGHAGIAGLDAADCEWCHRADDAGALVWFDIEAWESEMREPAS